MKVLVKNVLLRGLLVSLTFLSFGDHTMAKENSDESLAPSRDRNPPDPVAPVRHKGLRFEAPTDKQGMLVVYIDSSGEQKKQVAWTLQLVNYWIHPDLETDVQDVYLKKLAVGKDGETLEVEDERGLTYLVDLKKRTFKIPVWPVETKIIYWRPDGKKWKYKVKLKIHNSLARELKFDGVSVAAKGIVSNNLFRVNVDGAKVDYTGEMMDRAKPAEKDFVVLKPGESYSVDVELTELYLIPGGRHKVEVGFEHTNHFSPDKFVMRTWKSDQQVFEGEGRNLTESKKPAPQNE